MFLVSRTRLLVHHVAQLCRAVEQLNRILKLCERLRVEPRAHFRKRQVRENCLLLLLWLAHVAEHLVVHEAEQLLVRGEQLHELLPFDLAEPFYFTGMARLYNLEVRLEQASLVFAVRRQQALLRFTEPNLDQLLSQTLALGVNAIEKQVGELF